MKACKRRISALSVVILICLCGAVFSRTNADAAEEDKDAGLLKTQKGLRFNVPEDWPIEERNGVVAPIPIEEYMERKFSDIASQLDAIKQDLAAKFEKLDSDLGAVKAEAFDKIDKLGERIDSTDESGQGLSRDLDRLLDRVSSLEMSLKDLSEESNSSKASVDNIAQQISNLESRLEQLEKDVEYMKYNVTPEDEEGWY